MRNRAHATLSLQCGIPRLLFTVAEAGNRNHVMDGYGGVMPGRAENRERAREKAQET